MKSILKIFVIAAVVTLPITAQQKENIKENLTGNLKADSHFLFIQNDLENIPSVAIQNPDKKSPILAGLFSLIIPGSGELYAGSYWKAALFVAIEAAVITTAVIYDGKGNDQTEKFENYADDYTNPDHHWSVVRYAEWLNDYHSANIDINPNENLPPWERVDWNQLNSFEHGSHKLPPHGAQQYYELIGKYYQYSAGWNDYSSGPNNVNMSPNFLFYSGLRGKANDYYNIASKAVIGIYINHFLSALDAVWTTALYNKDISMKMRVEKYDMADRTEFVPTLNVRFNF